MFATCCLSNLWCLFRTWTLQLLITLTQRIGVRLLKSRPNFSSPFTTRYTTTNAKQSNKNISLPLYSISKSWFYVCCQFILYSLLPLNHTVKHSSLKLCATFDGKLRTASEIILLKTSDYLLRTRCLTHRKIYNHASVFAFVCLSAG